MLNQHIDAMSKLVAILEPLPSEDRMRIMRAAAVLLGEVPLSGSVKTSATEVDGNDGDLDTLSPRARTWMKQNSLKVEELQQVFHVEGQEVAVIASHMPGKDKKEQTHNAYILTGLAQMLVTGTPSFEDKRARALCESSGCYDSSNHSAYLKKKGNEFTGTKDKGWTLTAPGLMRAAEIIKELNK